MRAPRAALVLAVALGLSIVWTPTARASVALRAGAITMSVTSVSPLVPAPSGTPTPISFQLTLTNTTGTEIDGIRVQAERGDPIGTQQALDADLANPSPPASTDLPISPTMPIKAINLPAGAVDAVTFTTTTSTADDGHICLCFQASLYPLYFSAHVTGSTGVDQALGYAATYLPIADGTPTTPTPVQVSWLWPLIDRPHRLSSDTVFTDDTLAAEVGPTGRLTRALTVAQQAGATVPLTLLIDPELLDELSVMAAGPYKVDAGTGTTAGTGQANAQAWLSQLHDTLVGDPSVTVELTPYADPDVESLQRNGLSWTNEMPSAMSARVSAALAGRTPDHSVAWPSADVLSSGTMRTLSASGVSTVVLDARAVSPHMDPNGAISGLARLQGRGVDVAAALTSSAIEKYAADAITGSGSGLGELPNLMAEIAVRSVQEPSNQQMVLVTPPRYVDAEVDQAVLTIVSTSTSTFSTPIALLNAGRGSLLPTGLSTLNAVPASVLTLADTTVSTIERVERELPSLRAMLDPADPAAQAVLAGIAPALQRSTSAGWHALGSAASADTYADSVANILDSITGGVRIVRPSSGAYTLTSTSSPLPITVENDLPYAVRVRVAVTTVNSLAGFSTTPTGVQVIDPQSKQTLHLATRIERSGRIQVQAVLLTPDDMELGAPVVLTVHSTALGVIGVVITVVSGAILALALLLRLVRRVRGSSTPQATP
jgi:hypothetical protein